MPAKEAGLWRVDGFEKGDPKPRKCTECGSKDLEFGFMSQDDDWDTELEEAWEQVKDDPSYPIGALEGVWANTHMDDPRFFFMRDHAECNHCGETTNDYGPRYYYDPIGNEYNLPRPLMPEDAKRAQQEYDRQSKLDAGQMELPL